MTFENPWFAASVIILLGVFHLELVATLLHLLQLGRGVPSGLEEVFPPDSAEKRQAYITAGAKLDFTESAVNLALLVLFWWSGGFGYCQREMTTWGWDPILQGLAVFSALYLVQSLVSIPFSLYETFGIEAEYGFNRTSMCTYWADLAKNLLLTACLGLPLLAAVLWLFEREPLAPLYAWLLFVAFTWVMSFLAPRYLLPMFYKFTPLPEGELKSAVLEMAQKMNFPVTEISVVDGSLRSSKANAFFTGFGKNRRIALFDTLIGKQSTEEIVAVLAHEMGHDKHGHSKRLMVSGMLEVGLMLFLLSLALQSPGYFAAMGLTERSLGLGMIFFGILYRPLGLLCSVVRMALSRRYEFQADAFAKKAVGSPVPLIAALKKLAHDHLSHPLPHPFYVWLHYSHPPLYERIAELQK